MNYWELATSWNYFLSIERDLSETSRYIEPYGQENAYSFEFYKIIMLSCAEIESAFKKLCKKVAPDEKCGNMENYKSIILKKFPQICSCEVVIPRWHAQGIYPFNDWDSKPLFWWSAYQNVKHRRASQMNEATYKNAVYALAALYVILLYLYKVNEEVCKGDDSTYFWSKYCPGAHYLPPLEELPDFADKSHCTGE